jgi:hypothetical protein
LNIVVTEKDLIRFAATSCRVLAAVERRKGDEIVE